MHTAPTLDAIARPAVQVAQPVRGAAVPVPPTWRSEDLLNGKPEAHIEHAGSVYRLRLTMLGKLILTK